MQVIVYEEVGDAPNTKLRHRENQDFSVPDDLLPSDKKREARRLFLEKYQGKFHIRALTLMTNKTIKLICRHGPYPETPQLEGLVWKKPRASRQ